MLRLPLVFALVWLSGAAGALAMGVAAIGPTSYYPAYTPTVLNYAGTRGGMLLEVEGSAFGQMSDREVAASIAAIMESSHFGPTIPFIVAAPDDFASPYRIVVLFDGVQTVTPYTVCAAGVGYGPGVESPNIPGVVRLHAVLCGAEQPLTAVSGQVSGVDDPDDPAFRQLIGQMSILLFPPRRPASGNRDRGVFTP